MQPSQKFTNLIKKYGPGFIALSKTSNQVVAHGRDIEKMWKNAEKKNIDFLKSLLLTFLNTAL